MTGRRRGGPGDVFSGRHGDEEPQGSGYSWVHAVVIGGRLYIGYDTNPYCYNVEAE